MENKKIKAVIVEPNKKARIAEIESGLKSLQLGRWLYSGGLPLR